MPPPSQMPLVCWQRRLIIQSCLWISKSIHRTSDLSESTAPAYSCYLCIDFFVFKENAIQHSHFKKSTLTIEWPSGWDMILRWYEQNNAAEKGVRNDIWRETAKRLLNCKSRTFSNRKGFDDVRIIWSVSIQKPVFSSGLELRKIGQKCPTYKFNKKSSYFLKGVWNYENGT
jgi:hypothetical protein